MCVSLFKYFCKIAFCQNRYCNNDFEKGYFMPLLIQGFSLIRFSRLDKGCKGACLFSKHSKVDFNCLESLLG